MGGRYIIEYQTFEDLVAGQWRRAGEYDNSAQAYSDFDELDKVYKRLRMGQEVVTIKWILDDNE